MTHLSVLKFPTASGAEVALETLQRLQQQQLIALHDAAIVTWPQGEKKPKTRQLHNLAGLGALDGAFWGLLFGLLFFIPLMGAAIGAVTGALIGHFSNVGIDEGFVNQVRDKVTEGTSALFLLTSNEVADRVIDALQGLGLEVVATNLSQAEEEQLRAAFGPH